MPLTQLAWYLLVLAAAVAVDVMLFRWRRRNWQPAVAARMVEHFIVRLKAAFDPAVQGLRQRFPVREKQMSNAAAGVSLAQASPDSVPAARQPAKPIEADDLAPQLAPTATVPPAPFSAEQAAAVPADPPAAEAPVAATTGGTGPQTALLAAESPSMSVLDTSINVPIRVTSRAGGEPTDGVARLVINIEMPVGATLRFIIETGVGVQPTIIQEHVAPQLPAATPVPGAQPARLPGRRAPSLPAQPAERVAPVKPAAGRAVAPAGQRPWQLAVPAAWRGGWQTWRSTLAARVSSLPQALFWSSLVIYLVTRLIGIDQYPIYFFTDESVHTVLAADFVHAGLQNSDHEFLPTYFSLGPSFNLNGVSVYLQTIPYLLFGKSEYVTRATSALVTLIAAVAVGLILRDIFKRRYWWAATLLLSVTPAWFLHSRTAFEYIEVASYYAGFLYCYLRYRYISPRSLYGAVVFAALAFYTHGLGQALMAMITLLLAVADWRYHWQQRATVRNGLVLGLVLLLPYVRYNLAHPGSTVDQLRQRGSYWVQDGLPLGGKLSQFFSEYLMAFSPQFWFLANNGRDLERHVMKGYGNLWLPTFPLLALGLVYALRNVRSSSSRTVLLALLAAPVGSALVAIGIARVLWEIIPICLLSTIGLCLVLEWLEDHHVRAAALAIGIFVVLAGFNVYMLRDALVNGGLWSEDYTLAGTQFGARQVFGEAIPQYLAQHADAQVIVSATWANGTEMFVPFFLTPDQTRHVRLESLDYFVSAQRDLPPNLEIVLPAYEYDKAKQNPKLENIVVDKIIPYPNGQPGFYFLRLSYSAQAAGLFAADQAALHRPVAENYTLDGQNVIITHPRFGAGQLRDMLDGNRFTLINAPGFNPLVLDFAFPAARPMNGLTLITGSLPDFTVTATVYAGGTTTPLVYTQEFVGLPPDPTVMINFDKGPSTLIRLHLEIHNNADNGPGVNIHVREVQFH